MNYNKEIGRKGWIEFTKDNGLLNTEHPIVKGRTPPNQVSRLLTFRGSGLNGKNYTNLLKLSESSENVIHSTRVGPIGKGNSQILSGNVGKGKVVALADSN